MYLATVLAIADTSLGLDIMLSSRVDIVEFSNMKPDVCVGVEVFVIFY